MPPYPNTLPYQPRLPLLYRDETPVVVQPEPRRGAEATAEASPRDLPAIVASAATMADVLRALGLVPRGANYATIWRRIRREGIDAEHLRPQVGPAATIRAVDARSLAALVAEARTLAEVLRRIGVEPSGHTYRALRARLHQLTIDTSHLLGRAHHRGKTYPERRKSALQSLADGAQMSSELKERLFRDGVFERRCSTCDRTHWCGQPIPLEIDHINGRRDDNRLENLRVLCPNCHALTPTYRGRNIGQA